MNIREITPQIFYVGVNDRTTVRFESLWPLPAGVSYNSYIVKDKKTALIDTVELGEAYALFGHLDDLLGDTPVDYLVVNHMEPDHSGSIPLLAARYPQMKIVGNRQTVAMIGGFYHIDDPDRFIIVADGDTLPLGDRTLRFLLTPMVHWPETMMTFEESSSTLFTGDAFGTFGALNGGVVDFETDIELYLSEAYRYYSNIVGKYGKFVVRAMNKVLPLAPKYICPTHGPVWHEHIDRIAAIYDQLANYRSDAGVTIVYGSMYGNTEAVAEALASALAARGEKHIRLFNAGKDEMSFIISEAFRYDGLIVGSPTYSMTLFPPVDTFMKAMKTREVSGKTLGLFSSFTWSAAAGKELAAYAEQMNLPVAAALEMKKSMNDDTAKAIEDFADAFILALRKSREQK
ncbi:MAG: FprA family A-type flavoprotein [Muribaculaceae bacterium]|nr:FprA family A-type flavoprotein [Muribaculaceae bacterium]